MRLFQVRSSDGYPLAFLYRRLLEWLGARISGEADQEGPHSKTATLGGKDRPRPGLVGSLAQYAIAVNPPLRSRTSSEGHFISQCCLPLFGCSPAAGGRRERPAASRGAGKSFAESRYSRRIGRDSAEPRGDGGRVVVETFGVQRLILGPKPPRPVKSRESRHVSHADGAG